MSPPSEALLHLNPTLARSIRAGEPVVALESTLITHGLPWPANLETALAAEEAVRKHGVTPATIAVLDGRASIGLESSHLESLARQPESVIKASSRDLPLAISRRLTASTTVAATIWLAHQAGISVCATGGVGGAHRGGDWDISADLLQLARTSVAVVCAGAKSILDVPRTLQMLETLSVPVVGFRTHEFPGFYTSSTGEPVSARLDTAMDVAAFLRVHWTLQGAGVVIAQSLPPELALEPSEVDGALTQAEKEARRAGIRGGSVTPFLLARVAELTGGKSVRANQALIVANAGLAAEIAKALRAP